MGIQESGGGEKGKKRVSMRGLSKRASSGMLGSVPEKELFVWPIIALASARALKTALQNRRGKKTKPELSCSLFSWKTNYFLLVKHFLRNKTAAQQCRAKCGALSKATFRLGQMRADEY